MEYIVWYFFAYGFIRSLFDVYKLVRRVQNVRLPNLSVDK